jgi:hypothetical protein
MVGRDRARLRSAAKGAGIPFIMIDVDIDREIRNELDKLTAVGFPTSGRHLFPAADMSAVPMTLCPLLI